MAKQSLKEIIRGARSGREAIRFFLVAAVAVLDLDGVLLRDKLNWIAIRIALIPSEPRGSPAGAVAAMAWLRKNLRQPAQAKRCAGLIRAMHDDDDLDATWSN